MKERYDNVIGAVAQVPPMAGPSNLPKMPKLIPISQFKGSFHSAKSNNNNNEFQGACCLEMMNETSKSNDTYIDGSISQLPEKSGALADVSSDSEPFRGFLDTNNVHKELDLGFSGRHLFFTDVSVFQSIIL